MTVKPTRWRTNGECRDAILRWSAAILALLALTAAPVHGRSVTPSPRVSTAVLVRVEASTEAAVSGRMRPGESATVIGDVAGWFEVQLADGTKGYVSKRWTRAEGASIKAASLTASGYKVHVIDVGTGLAVFVEGKDFALLYDAGARTISTKAMKTGSLPTSGRSDQR